MKSNGALRFANAPYSLVIILRQLCDNLSGCKLYFFNAEDAEVNAEVRRGIGG